MSTTASSRKKKTATPPAWNLVTNHMNVLYMMAAGLVMEPAGFKKYYVDSLQANPGWVPLFRGGLPAQALEHSVSERSHLRPCVVSFELSEVSGSIQVVNKDGKARNADLPVKRWTSKGLCIFVPAPLPLCLSTRIRFRSEEDKQAFLVAAKDVANVNVESFDMQVDESLFVNATEDSWPPKIKSQSQGRGSRKKMADGPQASLLPAQEQEVEDSSEAELPVGVSAQSLAGSLAMLYHCGNSSVVGVEMFRLATEPYDDEDLAEIADPVLAQLPVWLRTGSLSPEADLRARLFWGAVSALDQALQNGGSDDPVEVVLSYLDHQVTQITDDGYRGRLERLTADMRGSLGLGGATISELFERHKGSLSRPLLLFCLRRTCVELLEFSHPLFSAEERLLSAVLFGVRDGWLKLPREARNPALSAYVMYRMAATELAQKDVELSLPEVQPPVPLRRLFGSVPEGWSQAELSVASELAKSERWSDCIQTTIASTDGAPLHEPRHENGKFIFDGSVSATTELNQERFLQRLGMWPPIGADAEKRVRDALAGTDSQELSMS